MFIGRRRRRCFHNDGEREGEDVFIIMEKEEEEEEDCPIHHSGLFPIQRKARIFQTDCLIDYN